LLTLLASLAVLENAAAPSPSPRSTARRRLAGGGDAVSSASPWSESVSCARSSAAVFSHTSRAARAAAASTFGDEDGFVRVFGDEDGFVRVSWSADLVAAALRVLAKQGGSRRLCASFKLMVCLSHESFEHDQIRSDQISVSLPSPRASACGVGIVHTFLTQEVTDNPAGVVSELFRSDRSRPYEYRQF